MGDKYSDNELIEILSGLEKNPEDDGIVYMNNSERDIVVPLVQKDFAKSVTISHPDPRAFAEATRNLFAASNMDEFEEFMDERELVMKGGELYFDDDEKLTSDDLSVIPSVTHEAFNRISEMVDPQGEVQLMTLFRSPGHKGPSPTPMLHTDSGLTVHVSGPTPLEYLVGNVTPEQRELLGKRSNEMMYPDDDLKSRIRTANVGDLTVFSEKLPHRSSSKSKKEGQANFLGMPNTGYWPDV